ncbi:hypothetical protein L1049_008900 [Liquidambar formosana]|uniref:Cystatin domain-containing protein n=1 Tax=Liquidambar formosana TaxID=63359 RepID=A0AAP0X4W5_LIQFO
MQFQCSHIFRDTHVVVDKYVNLTLLLSGSKMKAGYGSHGRGPGWRAMPIHHPEVQDAANHALKTLQQRSNSLSPYELIEIILAKAEVIDDSVKFELLLKVTRGSKEEKFKVEVNKRTEGTLYLNQMEHDHS